MSWPGHGFWELGGNWFGLAPHGGSAMCGWGCAPRGLERCLRAAGGAAGTPAWSGRCWGGGGLAVVWFTRGGGGGRRRRAGDTCVYGLCWVSQQNVAVSALKSAEPRQLLRGGHPGAIPGPGGTCSPAAHPGLLAQPWWRPGGLDAPSGARLEISVPSPTGMGPGWSGWKADVAEGTGCSQG